MKLKTISIPMRVYEETDVSAMTINEIEELFTEDDLKYSVDYGFDFRSDVQFKISRN